MLSDTEVRTSTWVSGFYPVYVRKRHLTATLPEGVTVVFRRSRIEVTSDDGRADASLRCKRQELRDESGATVCATRKTSRDAFAIEHVGGATYRVRRGRHEGQWLLEDGAGGTLGFLTLEYVLNELPVRPAAYQGRFNGGINLAKPVPLAVLVAAVRLAAGPWAKKAPRVGTWGGENVDGEFDPF